MTGPSFSRNPVELMQSLTTEVHPFFTSEWVRMSDIVECHSDYTYPERPVAFGWEGRRLEVAQILHEWRSPSGKGFRVRTIEGQEFELLYQEAANEWQIRPL